MNIKSVLRVYGQLRNLTDDETALLETLRSMTDTERELTVEALQPAKPPARKASKKGGTGKSRRASSLAEQMSTALKPLTDIVNANGESCMWVGNNGPCFKPVDDNVHHKQTDPDYHEFTATAKADDYAGETVGASGGANG